VVAVPQVGEVAPQFSDVCGLRRGHVCLLYSAGSRPTCFMNVGAFESLLDHGQLFDRFAFVSHERFDRSLGFYVS
jgi:hypothetical protein